MKVLGYTVGVTHASDFLGGEFYSLLYLVIMSIYAIFVATKLITHLVDNGSMAYLLGTPVSRAKVAATQAAVLFSGVLIIGLFSTVGALLGVHWFVHNSGMDAGYFVQLTLLAPYCSVWCPAIAFCFPVLPAMNDPRLAC